LKFTLLVPAVILAALSVAVQPAFPAASRPAAPAGQGARALSPEDQALREGWKLLSAEKYPLARDKFRKIDPAGYDLGDYVVCFTGLAWVREGKMAEGAAAWDNLTASFPRSPLAPMLAVELSWLAARSDNLALARRWYTVGRGGAIGAGRRAEEGYVAARLAEDEDPVRASEMHLQNFSAYSAQEGGAMSAERLAARHREGRFVKWSLPVGFYARYAKAAFRAGDAETAMQLYREGLRIFPPGDDYYALMYDFAEMLRKQGDIRASRALLQQAISASPAGRCSEASFLLSRVQWKGGNLSEARRILVAISDNGTCRPPVAERALHLAAWIAEEEGDLPWLTEAFGKLRNAGDETIRAESAFRYGYGLFRSGRFAEAAAVFDAGAGTNRGTVERARHLYWKARSVEALGRKAEAVAGYQRLSSDPGAGIYALFAQAALGRDMWAMPNAPSSLETQQSAVERDRLWDTVRAGGWDKADAAKLSRAERLARMGLLEYSVFEADRIDRAKVRKAVGVAEGGAAGLFRFLAGDLRGALREADRVPTDFESAGLIEKIQFPLAPEMVGDCDRKRSGMDPLVLHSVIRQESQFSPTILSPAGAVGLMQLMPRTAADTARRIGRARPKRAELVNPQVNVELGAAYLSRLVKGYGGDYMRAVAAYNAGETAVGRWWGRSGGDPAAFLENISYRETRGYVRRVFFNLLQYYRIYRPRMFRHFLATEAPAAQPVPGAPGTPPSGSTGGSPPPTPTPAPAGG
jgi:soluble lytic murein transglycosylase-like protein